MEKEQLELPSELPEKIATDSCFIKEHIIAEFVIISWIICLWELYLAFRQRRYMQKLESRPAVLENLLSTEVYDKSRTYALDKNTFSITYDIFSEICKTIFMVCFGMYYCWEWSKDFLEYVGLNTSSEIYITAVFITIIRIISTITDMPFTVYGTFVLEQKHKFNNQTPLFFIKDQIKKLIVSHVILVPVICGLIWIVKNTGDYFFIYMWLFTLVVSLLAITIYPDFIAPLFDKYSPLPEGELKTGIEALAASIGFPLYKLYIVEGSVRSSHSNAYLYGFYKNKRIVLFDTLIAEFQRKKIEEEKEKEDEQSSNENTDEKKEKKEIRGCETDEIIAVLGHELGHWSHSHTLKIFFITQVYILTYFVLFAQLLEYAPLYEAFGFTDSKPVIIGLNVIMSHVFSPVDKLVQYAITSLSRQFEFQADQFALKLGHGEPLKRALIKLDKDNLGYPLYDRLYSNYHHSHPPLLERLDALKKDD